VVVLIAEFYCSSTLYVETQSNLRSTKCTISLTHCITQSTPEEDHQLYHCCWTGRVSEREEEEDSINLRIIWIWSSDLSCI